MRACKDTSCRPLSHRQLLPVQQVLQTGLLVGGCVQDTFQVDSSPLSPSPPLLTFHGLLNLIGNDTINLAHTYVDSGLLYVRTTVLPKLCKERSKSRFVFISLLYGRIGTAAVLFFRKTSG